MALINLIWRSSRVIICLYVLVRPRYPVFQYNGLVEQLELQHGGWDDTILIKSLRMEWEIRQCYLKKKI
jgi:hypothetical protein